MASKKISQLTNATTPLTGNEEVPVVQGGTTVKTTAQDIADLAGTSTSLQEVTDVGNTTTTGIVVNGSSGNTTIYPNDPVEVNGSSQPISSVVLLDSSQVDTHKILTNRFRYSGEESNVTTMTYEYQAGVTANLTIPATNGTLATVEGLTYKQAKVTLSSAQILTLGTTPVTLVPAQGAGKVIIPVSVVLNYNFVTSAYSTSTNVFIASPSAPTSITRTGVLAFVADACTFDAPINSGASNALTGNEPLQISTGAGNPTGGDSTLDVYVAYYVITL